MNFMEQNIEKYNEWLKKYNDAKQYMRSRSGKKILIECAAQHPLQDGIYPGKEFSERLNTTINLYKLYSEQGYEVKIYVPGSRHKINDEADKISLSLSGKKYLISKGINAKDIYSTNTNFKYKKYEGVYNSADECYVATQIFKNDNFSQLISVVSPAQMYRKTLFYIEFGVIPLNYSAPVTNMFHNYIKEIFGDIPFVLLEDSSCQDNKSTYAISTRNDRCPYLKKKINELRDMSPENFSENYKIDEIELEEENCLNNSVNN